MQTTSALTAEGSRLAQHKAKLHAALGANVAFPMPMTPLSMIKTQVTPADLGLYRRLIPDGLGMPAQPMVQVEMLEARPGWREGSVCIRVTRGAEEGWLGLYWPIDSWVGYKFGRLVGYPKFMAHRMKVESSDAGARAEVFHHGRVQLSLDFRFEGASANLSAEHAQMLASICIPERERDVFLLVPPSVGPSLNRLTFKEDVPVKTRERAGSARVRLDVNEPFAGLFPKSEQTWPARFIERTGLGFGWLVAKREREAR